MSLPCEFAVRSVVPAMRALVARKLSTVYQMKQEDIAFLLGITQSAVSQYMRNARGKAIKIDGIDEVQDLVQILADGLASDSLSKRQITRRYCEACQVVRKKRILCSLHKRLNPDYKIEDCDACLP
jgi:predicted transcriptional regulator